MTKVATSRERVNDRLKINEAKNLDFLSLVVSLKDPGLINSSPSL